jgi:hypothetical protein
MSSQQEQNPSNALLVGLATMYAMACQAVFLKDRPDLSGTTLGD